MENERKIYIVAWLDADENVYSTRYVDLAAFDNLEEAEQYAEKCREFASVSDLDINVTIRSIPLCSASKEGPGLRKAGDVLANAELYDAYVDSERERFAKVTDKVSDIFPYLDAIDLGEFGKIVSLRRERANDNERDILVGNFQGECLGYCRECSYWHSFDQFPRSMRMGHCEILDQNNVYRND